MKSKINALLFFFLFFNQCLAQQIHFVKSYFNTGYYTTGAFVELKDSGFILIGHSGNGTAQPILNFLMRIDKYGDTLFTREYGSGYFTNALLLNDSIILTANGFPYINNYQVNTIKININTADTFDFRYYGYYNQGYSGGIFKFSDNGFIMINEDALDYGIIKLDSNENVQWHIPYYMYQGISDVAETPFGGYVACGSDGSGSLEPYRVLYVNDSGNTIWSRNYGNNPNFIYQNTGNIRILPDSNFLVACNGLDWHLMKLNHLNGDTIWTRITDSGIGIIYLSAYKNKTFLASGRTKIYLLDLNGDSIWAKDCPPFFHPLEIHPTSDGGFAYTAKYSPPPYTFELIGFVKCDSSGNTVFTSVFNAETMQPITFYPNPASTEFYINTSTFTTEKKLTITLTNMQGKQVLQQEYYKEKAVDVSCLPNGIYVVEVRGKEKVIRGKVVVQH